MTSVKKAIKVYVRLKPTDSSICKFEIDKHVNDDGSTDDILILNSNYGDDTQSINRSEAYKFRYSKVFDEKSSQHAVFDEICQPVLESALQGYNGTVFAYGQTGSGKTYTMTGSRTQWKNRGIIPRALSYIFEKFSELTDQGFIASAFLSYLEIYNENGYDLLHSGFSSGRIEDLKKVQLLEDAQQQIHMKNLTVHPIKSEDEAMQLLYLGDHNRIIAETPMNEASTRSHCIFTIHINIREGDSSTVRRSKVHLVDLAGSERLANSNSSGQLFHEARHINLALHYLEQVIVALGEAHRSHIPYRNSMMTSILRDSLGGNCMTSMIANVSLEQRNIMETLSTCRFSQRVALVTNAAVLNEETDPMLLIAQLKAENRRLKEIIANSAIRQLEQNPNPLSQEEVSDCWKLVEKFISDADDEAILPIQPDMRLVQTCFRCLKMAVQMNKEDIVKLTPEVSASCLTSSDKPQSKVSQSEISKYTDDMSKDQLLEALKIRDAEIDVLSKMLRPQKSAPSRFFNHHPYSTSNFEHGDGPLQFSHSSHPGGGQHLAQGLSEDDEEDENGIGYQKMTISHQENIDSPICSGRGDFDADYIAGLSEPRKQALDSFLRSYKGRDRLETARQNLLFKKNEVESIDCLLRRNVENLGNLQRILMNADTVEEDDTFMRNAVESQAQSIQKQEKQLAKCREEMRQVEESLKTLSVQLMSDFEKHWKSMKEIRSSTSRTSHNESTPEHEPKPFSEVTKGIVKGVGGNNNEGPQSTLQRHLEDSLRRRNKKPDEFYVAPSAHISKSLYSPGSGRNTSARRRHSTIDSINARGDSGGRSSKGKSREDTPRNTPTLVITVPSKGTTVPPGTPATAAPLDRYTPQHNVGGDSASPKSTSDRLFDAEIAGFHNNDDEDLINVLTGVASIDDDILEFFRNRQLVFKHITEGREGPLV